MDPIISTALIILAMPILSYLVTFFFGEKLPRRGDFVGVGLMAVAWILALRIFARFWVLDDPATKIQQGWTWLEIGRFHIDAGILVDGMTAVMLVVVTTVSFLVHVFSMGYMKGDRRYARYFAFLGWFTFAMLGIVLADNLFFLYVFWELVGVASYLLIGFFFHKDSAANAGKKAFLVNRVGDFGFWLGILLFFTTVGSFRYTELFAAVHHGALPAGLLTVAGVLLFMGCVGKSAQMPLHIWLPDAMEGPTPVSALIHAATMVAAGVYMIARLFPLFTPNALLVIAYVGAITAFVTATIAIVQTDIKRGLAYSTLSQLGYMVTAVGVGGVLAGMFHLTTHAMFKALLFLGSGAVIHAMHHEQDMRQMGGLRHKLPITFVTFTLATLAISGVPPFSGFYSKDAILASALAFAMEHPAHWLPFALTLVAAGITSFYMFRIVFMTFTGAPRNQEKHDHAHEVGASMSLPLMVLALLAVVAGGLTPAGSEWFGRFVGNPEPLSEAAEHIHHQAHNWAMALSLLFAGAGILFSWLTYQRKVIDSRRWQQALPGTYRLLINKYWFDEIYQATVIRWTLLKAQSAAAFDKWIVDGAVNGVGYLTRGASNFTGAVDKWVVDGLVNGTGELFRGLGAALQTVQTGRIQTYLLGLISGLVILILVYRVAWPS